MKMLDFDDVLIVPRVSGAISSRKDVDIVREFYIRGNTLKCVPIISSNMTQTGTFKLALELLNNDYLAAIHKFYAADDIIKFIKENQLNTANLFITIGLRNKDDELKKLKQITDSVECPFSILIDVPNGYIKDFYLFVKQVRTLYPNKIIAAGNVCEREGCNRLFEAGADIAKIGIGPSSICNTRIKTGVGYPQYSSIKECCQGLTKEQYIMADGGFKNPGDICKAFVAGADFCMTGSLFAGCTESDGEVIPKVVRTNEYIIEQDDLEEGTIITDSLKPKKEIKYFKEYYGMSSFRAQRENYGEVTTYGTSEGVEHSLVPFTGNVINTINDINGSLRSCGAYIGYSTICDFKEAQVVEVNRIK